MADPFWIMKMEEKYRASDRGTRGGGLTADLRVILHAAAIIRETGEENRTKRFVRNFWQFLNVSEPVVRLISEDR
ncbi:hypothetical protein N0V88_007299 [Collariella sp. IMI 366227]|nr:hypothetical protein N0V88_007299 [Collariella sp. IMI 366227]